ncbi:MAG: hypothetical protein WC556_13995 [Candidatus Methanoperedens sp.]
MKKKPITRNKSKKTNVRITNKKPKKNKKKPNKNLQNKQTEKHFNKISSRNHRVGQKKRSVYIFL